jgi:integrase
MVAQNRIPYRKPPGSNILRFDLDEIIAWKSPKTKSCLRETKRGFRTACKLARIEGLIWKDLRATFGTRLAEAGCGAFTIAQLLGHSDVRVTMRYVRAVEDTKRVAVEAIKLSARKNVQVLASWSKQAPVRAAVND